MSEIKANSKVLKNLIKVTNKTKGQKGGIMLNNTPIKIINPKELLKKEK